jgi:hypothetical protein
MSISSRFDEAREFEEGKETEAIHASQKANEKGI